MSIFQAEKVVPVIIIIGAIALASSEFMTAFEFTPPGGEALKDVTGGDRHGYSNLILAIAAVVVMVLAIASGSKPAAYAVAALGIVALLLFLVVDLPDVGQRGSLSDPLRDLATAEAVPQGGFWMQAIGAVALAVGGGLFAAIYGGRWQQEGEWNGAAERRGGAGQSSPAGTATDEADGRGRRSRAGTSTDEAEGRGGADRRARRRTGKGANDPKDLPFDQGSSPSR